MDLTTGWLSPNGEMYTCGSYDHVSTAEELVKKYKYVSTVYFSVCDDLLMERGWVYIGISSLGAHEWRIGWKKFLTESQKSFLRPYFEDSEIPVSSMSRINWENEFDSER